MGIPAQAGVFEENTLAFRDQDQVRPEVCAKVSETKMCLNMFKGH